MPNRIIVSVTNDLATDQRVHKVCTSLQAFGFDVLLVGFKQFDSKVLDREYLTCRFSMWFAKGPFFYAEFSVRLFFFLLFNKSDHLLSNDLDTLLPNYLVSKIKRNSLIFDSHEIFSDSPELNNRPRVQKFWQSLESFLLTRVKHSYTVCKSLADHFNQKLGIEMKVVRNVPYKTSFEKRKHNNKTLIFQGNMNKCRGLDLAIRCLAFLPDFNLIIVGGGFDYLKDLGREIGVLDRVEFVGKIPFEEVKKYTQKASIGLLFEEPIGLSFTYSLPNKLFDYIHSDLKIIASPLKEVKAIIDKYKLGILLNNRNPKDVAAQIELLYNTDFNNSDFELARHELNWQKEEAVLASVYHSIKK